MHGFSTKGQYKAAERKISRTLQDRGGWPACRLCDQSSSTFHLRLLQSLQTDKVSTDLAVHMASLPGWLTSDRLRPVFGASLCSTRTVGLRLQVRLETQAAGCHPGVLIIHGPASDHGSAAIKPASAGSHGGGTPALILSTSFARRFRRKKWRQGDRDRHVPERDQTPHQLRILYSFCPPTLLISQKGGAIAAQNGAVHPMDVASLCRSRY